MKNKIILTLLLLVGGITCLFAAENVTFKAFAPTQVAMNQQFKLEYSITNATPALAQPNLDDFSVLMGPQTQRGQSVSIVNGKVDQQTNMVITYILTPKKEGTFTISPISFKNDGETVMCNAVTIKVVAAGQANSQQGGAAAVQNGRNISNSSATEAFVKTTYSKRSVYEQEEIVATIKLYHKGNVVGLEDVKFPEYKGCITKEIQMKKEELPGEDVVDGIKYHTYILKKTILYPQKSGKLEIEKGELSTIMEIQTRPSNVWDFDSFFNTTRRVRKIIPFEGTQLEVKPLPEGKPADFNNAVGSFKMESSISKTEAKAFEPITIKVKISGTGNIKYIKSPTFNFPTDFDVYEPKENTKTNGNSGTREIDYLIIPRHAGEFEIPAASFSYFDLNSKRYNTLKTESFSLNIEKGENTGENTQVVTNFATKENVQILGKDIRFINTQNTKVEPKVKDLYGTFGFWMWYIIPLIIFVVLVILYRKQIKENANIALVKNKRANKQAKKRLKQADAFLKQDDKEHFYEEIAKALWGYTSDKLNIPMSELNKENIESELQGRQVSEDTIKEYMEILHTCEFARFAPSASGTTMEELYNQTADVIGKLEEQVR